MQRLVNMTQLTLKQIQNLLLTVIVITLSLITLPVNAVEKNKTPILTLNEFIKLATQNDIKFETILIDQLSLKHRRDILLPDSNIIMDKISV